MFFKKNDMTKDLLRKNLDLIDVDMFYIDDPIVGLSDSERKLYLKKFYDIVNDKDVMERFKYLVNKQYRITAKSDNSDSDFRNGGMVINGIATVSDDFSRLRTMFEQESSPPADFDKFEIIND